MSLGQKRKDLRVRTRPSCYILVGENHSSNLGLAPEVREVDGRSENTRPSGLRTARTEAERATVSDAP